MCSGSVIDSADLLGCLDGLRTDSRDGRSAPHKPLLLLWALARVQRGEPRLASFVRQVEPEVSLLIAHFGGGKWQGRPSVPFWRLRSDGLWEVPGSEEFGETSKGDVHVSDLRRADACGGFTPSIQRVLRRDHRLVHEVARRLLDRYFPVTMHGAILSAVGYVSGLPSSAVPFRQFENAVLDAYDRRCAICDFSLDLAGVPLGLGAAHIKWRVAGGPDQVQNGLALCGIHQATWERGAISLTATGSAGFRILVSSALGAGEPDLDLVRLPARSLRPPADLTLTPSEQYTEWHRQHVFRG